LAAICLRIVDIGHVHVKLLNIEKHHPMYTAY